jgi:hypothetical protein
VLSKRHHEDGDVATHRGSTTNSAATQMAKAIFIGCTYGTTAAHARARRRAAWVVPAVAPLSTSPTWEVSLLPAALPPPTLLLPLHMPRTAAAIALAVDLSVIGGPRRASSTVANAATPSAINTSLMCIATHGLNKDDSVICDAYKYL